MLAQSAGPYFHPRENNEWPSSSSNKTPSSNPVKRPPNPIGLRTAQILDSDVTMEASNGSPKPRKKPKQTSGTPPSSESSGFTGARLRGRGPIIYDMKYHPMDEVLRPNSHATLSARSQKLVGSSLSNSLTRVKERENDHSNPDMERKRPHISKNQPTRNSPRFTRSDKQSEKRAKYNDDQLRRELRKSHSLWLKKVSIPATSSSSTASPGVEFNNPFTKPTSPDWRNLEHFDRRVYILQKGAPVQGTTLPLEWNQVVEILVMEGFFTEREFKSVGGLTALTSRYETIRLEIEGFFKSAPEPADKRNWPIRYAEDLRVFELGSGTKYWRHQRHSIFNPRSITITNQERTVTANSEDFGNGSAAAIARKEHATPTSAISEAFYESALGAQLDSYNGNIDRLPDDQDHSFEEAFDLLQPSVDTDSMVAAILDDPFVWSDVTTGIPKQPQPQTTGASSNPMDDCSIHAATRPSDPKPLIKKGRRGPKAKSSTVSFQIFEDEPGGTPLVHKYIAMNPASPGTDIPKENFENRRSPGESEGDSSDNYRLIGSRSRQHLVAVPPSPQSNRFRAVRAVQPLNPVLGSPSNSEAMTAESDNLGYQPGMQAPTVTPSISIRRSIPFTSVISEEEQSH
ncbi:hypothetical protein MMC29_002406 [Sticta canariensis]|nr:hypothetical protein [Sticta canariensis]